MCSASWSQKPRNPRPNKAMQLTARGRSRRASHVPGLRPGMRLEAPDGEQYSCSNSHGLAAADRHARWAAVVTIQDYGSIGELVGAVATIATLAYLAVQIRANTRMTSAQSGHVAHQLSASLSLSVAENPQLAGVFRRGISNYDALEPDEKTQFIFVLSNFVANAENSFNDFKTGIKTRARFDRDWMGIRHLVSSPGGRAYWKRFSFQVGTDFRAFVESDLFEDADPGTQIPQTAAQQSAAADSA